MALALAIMVSGCGGNDVDAEPADPITPTPTAPPQVVVPPGAQIPESDGGGVPVPPAKPGSPAKTGECAALQAVWAQTNQALVNLSPDHPWMLVDSFRLASTAMEQGVPLEPIEADWITMLDYLSRISAAFDDVDPNDGAAVNAVLAAVADPQETEAIAQASARITVYLAADCIE